MALLKFKKGLYEELPAVKQEGTVYITTDEKAMYVDISDSQRIRIGQIITLTKSDWQNLPQPFSADVFYYITDINALIRWNGTAWIQINSTEALANRIGAIETALNGTDGLIAKVEAQGTAITTLTTTVQGTDGNGGLKKELADLAEKVNDLEVVGGQANVIEKITVAGNEVAPTNKTVALGKLAGTDAKVASSDLDATLESRIAAVETAAGNAVDRQTYETKVNTLQGEIDAAEGDIATINTKLGVKFTTEQGHTVTDIVNTIQTTLGSQGTTLTQHGESIGALNTTVGTHGTDITQLKKDVVNNAAAAKAADDKAVAAGNAAKAADDKAAAAQVTADNALTKANSADGKADANTAAIGTINTTLGTLATKQEVNEQKTSLEAQIKEAKDAASDANTLAMGNATLIGENAAAIEDNAKAIETINTTLGTHETNIGNKVDKTDFEAKVGAEGTLTKAVADNTKAIEDNTKAIEDNAKAIEDNAEAIEANKTSIESLTEQIGNLSNVMNFRGVTSTDPDIGIITIDGELVEDFENGDVVIYGTTGKEFVYSGNDWHEFGDTSAAGTEISNLDTRVKALEATVGDAESGLVATVADHTSTLAGHTTTLETYGTNIATLMSALTWGSFAE